MGIHQSQRWCLLCERMTLHGKSRFSFGIGCLASLLTGCLFLPFWLVIVCCYSLFAPDRCQICGTEGNPSQPPRGWRPRPQGSSVILLQNAPYAPALPSPPPPAYAPGPIDIKATPSRHDRPRRPPFDWKPILASLRGCRDSVIRTYVGLPEWAQPIVWGLGIAAPLISLMVAARYAMR